MVCTKFYNARSSPSIMPGQTGRDTGHKALCPVSILPAQRSGRALIANRFFEKKCSMGYLRYSGTYSTDLTDLTRTSEHRDCRFTATVGTVIILRQWCWRCERRATAGRDRENQSEGRDATAPKMSQCAVAGAATASPGPNLAPPAAQPSLDRPGFATELRSKLMQQHLR